MMDCYLKLLNPYASSVSNLLKFGGWSLHSITVNPNNGDLTYHFTRPVTTS
jgi:hypothetical protein